MLSKLIEIICAFFFSQSLYAQVKDVPAKVWADKEYNKLTQDERIAQLMVVRLSSIDNKTKVVSFFDETVLQLVKKYNIGGVCLFQGSPVKQAVAINKLQTAAKTPILICIDAEWGVGMRIIDSVLPLPRQMMLGAMKDKTIIYKYGQLVAAQCKRIGVQVNYAPVVDINNNPNNPVINDRSFGEDKYKVAEFGIQYMKGMQDAGVMACAKHFPGHGDVATDSHFDLPVINKSMAQLDSLEFYPFRKIFDAGVGSVMLAHLYIPAIDNTANRASSLSPKNINELMRKQMHYNGLTFTDALEMQGVKKFFPNGEASVQSLIAGNDMLCLPEDVPNAIKKIKEAIKQNKLSWAAIELHCKKVLMAKYNYGLNNYKPINTSNLTVDLNSGITAMRKTVAENAITLVAKKDDSFFPLKATAQADIAFVAFGTAAENELAKRLKQDYNATIFNSNEDGLNSKLKKYKKIVIGIHNVSRFPTNNFKLSETDVLTINNILQNNNAIAFLFGNAYAAKNFCNAPNLVVCYEDDAAIQAAAADLLQGKIFYKGTLPVTVCDNLKYGFGLFTQAVKPLFKKSEEELVSIKKKTEIDSVIADAISKHAMPGCVILALKDGKIIFEKAYGNFFYEKPSPVSLTSLYDVASITKICATTLCIMKLYEDGKIDLQKHLSNYLPETIGTNKADITIENLLLHQAGLQSYIPFYKETIDALGKPLLSIYSTKYSNQFSIKIAENIFMKSSWIDTMYKRILSSPVTIKPIYTYSDNDFIFLAKIVERVTNTALDEYVMNNFYKPMKLNSIGFNPLLRNNIDSIAPTEHEKIFRQQIIRGSVHDPGAAMLGGVAGHAGIFSNVYDLAAIMQMLLDSGKFNGIKYFKPETIALFTKYNSDISRRGYGFDKPEKDNLTKAEHYPSAFASAQTFGHTGFTGTCAWADPANKLVFIFFSNRVYPDVSDKLIKMNVRVKLMDLFY